MPIFKDTLSQRELTKKEAEQILEEIVNRRNASEYPFKGTWENDFRKHCSAVAQIAETIAERAGMDSQKAYVLGLLHDCGKYKDERAEDTFHGIEGYHYMISLNLPECARISITHCFYQKDFNAETYPYNSKKLSESRNFLQTIEYNDYDRLLQLADMMNDMGKICTIDYRFNSISQRYNMPLSKMRNLIDIIKELKNCFDEKCGCNIYDLLGVEE